MTVTPYQAYHAMMKAADFIEANPEKYNYMSTTIPDSEYECNACMIGWFGYFLKQNSDFQIEVGELYKGIHLAEHAAGFDATHLYCITDGFSSLPERAVQKMRAFAERYWGHAKNDAVAVDKTNPSKYDWQKLMNDLATGPNLLEAVTD